MIKQRDNEIALILRIQRPSSSCMKEAFRASVPPASNIRENWRKNADICRAETLVERNISLQLKFSKKYFLTSLSTGVRAGKPRYIQSCVPSLRILFLLRVFLSFFDYPRDCHKGSSRRSRSIILSAITRWVNDPTQL